MAHSSLSRAWHYIRHIHPWYFLVLAAVFVGISLFALRANNLQMVRLREAVYEADKGGDQATIEKSLRQLRTYIYGHMNTSLTSGTNAVWPPIQLQYTYERAQAAHQAQLGQNNAAVYHDAQQACAAQQLSGAEAIACIENYVTARGIQLGDIPEGLYKFDFTSAKWSPDLAGWSIVGAAMSLIAFLVAAAHHWWKKYGLLQ